jgi:hypothetical protein
VVREGELGSEQLDWLRWKAVSEGGHQAKTVCTRERRGGGKGRERGGSETKMVRVKGREGGAQRGHMV